ncbi:MAG: efflux RND transporter periplasmic adaptor subunit [Clostridiales bacterium]|jgi:multidrug efflux pump subunit AcrA (membrane-fusion protein)|nr:efflux RND transporter periplasmic adaptor subunit [Clostridiales bacterium]
MNKKRVLLIALALTVLLSGCGGKDDTGEPDPIPVRLETVAIGSIQESVNFSGDVTAGSEVQVVPKTAGRIARVAVQVGQEVKKGDLLVELEAQELAVGLRQAEAALAMARANLKSGQSGVTLAQKQQAEANYNNAKSTLERMEALYAQGGISLQQLEGTRMQYLVAESQYTLAKQQLDLYERGEGQIEVMAAQVKQAEAGLEMARLNYNNSRITAPIDGVVAMVSAEVGNMASPGMPVATMINVEGVSVTARLTEQTIGLMAPGMAVTVEVSGERFVGEVREVAPSPLTGTKSYPVKIRVFDASGIRPGMFARVMVDVAASDGAVLVPRSALIEQDGKYHLFTVKEGKAVKRDVAVGLKNDTHAEITSGFGAGEPVVTAGQHFLRDGVTVLVEEGGLQ